MRFFKQSLMSLGVLIVASSFALAQTPAFFTFTTGTGNNATVAVPTTANPSVDGTPLDTGDEIGVFTPTGLCVGGVVWTAGQNAAITVWGDNDQTPAIDGLKAGEEMHYRIWRKAANSLHQQISVTYAQGDGKYAANGIYIVSTLNTPSSAVHEDGGAAVARDFILHQNYPNPFNPETTIEYQLPQPSQVKVVIYNLAGQSVRTLIDAPQAAGRFRLNWDGKDEAGNSVTSGVYLYELQANDFGQQGR